MTPPQVQTYRYAPLEEGANISLMILVPGSYEDPIRGSFLPCDLDADYYHFTGQDPESAESNMLEMREALKNATFTAEMSPEIIRATEESLAKLGLDDGKETEAVVLKSDSTHAASTTPASPDHRPIQAPHSSEAESWSRPFSGTAVGSIKVDVETHAFPMPCNHNMSGGRMNTHAFQPYTAVSSCLGSAVDSKAIWIDGDSIPVAPNLYSCIQSLRDAEEGKLIWADALCINQADMAERASQVRLMSRIYQQAERTVMYVGDAAVQDCVAMGPLVQSILRAGEECDKAREGLETEAVATKASSETFSFALSPYEWEDHYRLPKASPIRARDHGLLSPDHGLWNSWRHFFASPYFQRTWVLQEIAFAKKLELIWGKFRLRNPYDALSSCMDYALQYSATEQGDWMAPTYDSVEEYAKHADTLKNASLGYRGLNAMFLTRRRMESDSQDTALEDTTLIWTLEKVSSFQATDPRDKVYAMIGVSSDAAIYSAYIDYSQPMPIVYRTFGRLLIDRGHGVRLLHQAAVCRRKLTGEPSWVPNWSAGRDEVELVDDKERDADVLCAAAALHGQDSQVRTLPELNRIAVKARIVDSVAKRGPTMMPSSLGDNVSLPSLSIVKEDFLRFFVKSMMLLMEEPAARDNDNFMEVFFLTLVNGPSEHALGELDEMRKAFQALVMQGPMLLQERTRRRRKCMMNMCVSS